MARLADRGPQVSRLKRYPLLAFFVLAYAYTWTVCFIMLALDAPIEWSILAGLGPTLAALAVQRGNHGDLRAFRIISTPGRTMGASIAGVLLMAGAYVVLPAVAVSDPKQLHWAALLSPALYNYSMLLGGPLVEEPGWRGFALPRMQARFGPWRAALLLGVLWTCWHLPFFWNPRWPHPSFSVYLPWLVSASVLMSLATNWARFAVLPAILMHAVHNTVGDYLRVLMAGVPMAADNWFWTTIGRIAESLGLHSLGLSFDAVFAGAGVLVALFLIAVTRGRLGAC